MSTPPTTDSPITAQEFALFQRWIYRIAGVDLAPTKTTLVSGRLARRLKHHGCATYADYYRLLNSGKAPEEIQIALDLLTTHETYFFREPRHFEFLREQAQQERGRGRTFRVWSAASASGEEAYSIAMTLANVLRNLPWEVLASDVSARTLAQAKTGAYSLERGDHIPPHFVKTYFVKNPDDPRGYLVTPELRQRIKFMQINLNGALPALGLFDVIFLRNVMIYFDMETKRKLVAKLATLLQPGGHLIVGHAESLNGVCEVLHAVVPSIYLKKP